MPELPEVETVRRGLAFVVTGRRIERVTVLHPRPVRRHLAGPDDFATTLEGRTFAEPKRRGKYLWLPFTDGDALLAHLGKIGVNVPFDFGIHQDNKDSTKYVPDIGQGGLGMPDRDYYLKADDKKLAETKAKLVPMRDALEP